MIKKSIAALALVGLLVPSLALAQSGVGVSVGANATGTEKLTGNARVVATVTAQANRILQIADLFAALSVKLQLRIASSTASSTDIATATEALNDLNAQVADARVQANAAFTHMQNAAASGASKTTIEAELKMARADMVVARKDLGQAREDIAKVFAALHVRGSSTH